MDVLVGFVPEMAEDAGGVVAPEDEGDALVRGVDAVDELAEGGVGDREGFEVVVDGFVCVRVDLCVGLELVGGEAADERRVILHSDEVDELRCVRIFNNVHSEVIGGAV